MSLSLSPVKCGLLPETIESNRDNRDEAAEPNLCSVTDKLLCVLRGEEMSQNITKRQVFTGCTKTRG